MSERLVLVNGREIRLHELRQVLIYSGSIGGPPTTSVNRNIVAQIRENPTNHLFGQVPYVIPPRETLLELAQPLSYGTAAVLPGVRCIARFEALDPTRDGAGDYSVLVVAWFQDEFALPVDAQVLAHIQGLKWDELATNHEW